MKSLAGKISLVDMVTQENKTTADEHLERITKLKERPKPMIWNEFFSGMGGNIEIWNFSEIPKNLQFFERIRVLVIKYNILPMPYVVSIEGTFSKNVIENLEGLRSESCRKQIEKFRNNFWNYWKENFTGLVSASSSRYFNTGSGIVDFSFKIESTSELLKTKLEVQDHLKFRENESILFKYAANTGGLISFTEMFGNKISIVTQGNSVLYGGGFDFSWISKFEFFEDENLFLNFEKSSLMFARHDNLLQVLIVHLWQDYRINEIEKWKNKIVEFSNKLEKFRLTDKLKSNEIEMSPLSEKRIFLINFTSILDENRLIDRFTENQWSRYKETVGGEVPIKGISLVGIENEGFLYNFYTELSRKNRIIKEEYEVLDHQYEILSSHLDQLLSLINTKSSVQLSESNEKTQKYLVSSAIITAVASVAIGALTIILLFLTTDLVNDSHYSADILTKLDKTNNLVLANLYSNYELKLQYEIDPFDQNGLPIGRAYNLWVTNYGDYNTQVNSTWYLNEELCDANGSHIFLNRTLTMSHSIAKSDIIERKEMVSYTLDIPQIYPNYTNLEPFTIEIVAKGTPVTPDKTPINYFTKTKIARVQFVYDNKTNIWIPQLGWNELDCKSKPPQKYFLFQLDTENMTQFRDIG